jgi:hypothetical protein
MMLSFRPTGLLHDPADPIWYLLLFLPQAWRL